MDVLTPEEVPAFMYLMHCIEKKEGFKNSKNKPKEVAKNGSFEDYHKVTTRTIRRAFRLYKNLCRKRVVFTDYNRPSRETLNVLSQYRGYIEGERKTIKSQVFECFIKHNKAEIETYYATLELTKDELELILDKKAPKVELYKAHLKGVEKYRDQIKTLPVDKFISGWANYAKIGQLKRVDYLKLKQEFIVRLNEGIDKGKIILFWYSIFGTLVFLFIAVPEYLDLKDYLVEILESLSNSTELENEIVEEDENEYLVFS